MTESVPGKKDAATVAHKPISSRLTFEARSGPRVRGPIAGWLEEAERDAIQNARNILRKDISGFRPEDLRVIDALLDRYYVNEFKRRNQVEGATAAYGSYLGEVLVRNLGARWHTPSWFQALAVVVSRSPLRAERSSYVWLGSEKIHVFRAAHEAVDKTGAVFSLYGFYQRYARKSSSVSGGGPLA